MGLRSSGRVGRLLYTSAPQSRFPTLRRGTVCYSKMVDRKQSIPCARPKNSPKPIDLETRENGTSCARFWMLRTPPWPPLTRDCPNWTTRLTRLQQGFGKIPTDRLVYAGAGTSARLGVQDGVELVPTFGWPEERLAYLIAGGPTALTRTAEGAEDDTDQAVADARDLKLGRDDVCIALSASGVTPYAIAASNAARTAGALTIGIANNPGTPCCIPSTTRSCSNPDPNPSGVPHG